MIRPDWCVDIVMCIDATASMAPYIDDFKKNIYSYIEKLEEGFNICGKMIEQLRVKVITFRDFAFDDEPMTESQFFMLPAQQNEFQAYIDSIEAKGNGNGYANALEAFALAIKSNWTTGGRKGRHIVFMFSNSSVLALGERADCELYPTGMPKDFKQLSKWWEETDKTFDSTYQSAFGRLIAFVPQMEPWIEVESWNRYLPLYLDCKVSEEDILMTFDIIVGGFDR